MNNEAAEGGGDGAEVKKCTNPDAQKLAATTEEPAPRGEVHQDGSGEQAGKVEITGVGRETPVEAGSPESVPAAESATDDRKNPSEGQSTLPVTAENERGGEERLRSKARPSMEQACVMGYCCCGVLPWESNVLKIYFINNQFLLRKIHPHQPSLHPAHVFSATKQLLYTNFAFYGGMTFQ